jgi:PKD repeat protein
MGSAGTMLVYRSDISGVHRIMAQPLDAAGNPLTTEPILLDTGDSTYGPGFPTVAWNGSLYLVSWNNSNGVVAQRIQQDGTLVDPSPFVVMPGHGPTDVAALGDVFLVTGMLGTNPEYVSPMAARVRGSDGVVLDNPALTLGSSFAYSPSVAVVGGRWLVVWESHPTHDNPIADTMAAFVDADGVHPAEFFVYGSYTTSSYSYGPSLASNGSEALVLQNAEISSGVEMDLVARIVHSDGTLQPAITLTPWAGNQYYPRVAWDGSRFIVVYQDQRNRLAEWELDQLDARSDLFGMRIASDGTILDPTGFIFSNSTGAEAYPNIAAADGTSLIAASIMRDPPYSSYRVGYELFGLGGNAWPVAVATAAPWSGDVPLPVTFSSAGSTDLDGSLASYAWDFGDGSGSSDANPTHTYTTGGPFVVTLIVTDNQGAQTTTTVFVKALNPNQLPVANASADPMGGIPPFNVVFYATGSYDPDGWLGNFHWTFSDGGEYWGTIAYATVYTTDPFTATLTVFDNRNGTGTATVVINSGNYPPVLDPIGAKTVDELTTLVFTATASDPDVPGQTLTFSLGPGAPSGASIDPLTGVFTWTPTEAQGPGIYPLKVIVTDNGTFPLSDYEIIQVTVNEVNLDPIVDAGPDQEASEGQPVHFTGSFVDPGLLASPQAGETILWDFGDGVTTTGVLTPTHSFGNNGNFTVTLTVTDTYGGAGHDSLQVSTTNVPPVLDALPDRTIGPGQVITINGTLTDPGWLDTHTLTIEWAPGVTETLDLAAGVYEFQLSHVYTVLGDYTVTITAADPDGGLSSQVFTIKVQLFEVFLPLTQR